MADTGMPSNSKASIRSIASTVALFAAFAAVPFVAQLLDQPFYIKFVTRIVIFAIASVSLSLILSWGGMVSFGHAAFMGIAGYTVGILAWHATHMQPLILGPLVIDGSTSALWVWPLALLMAGFAGFLIGFISLRTSGLYFIMITLAFAQMIYYSAIALQKYGGDDGMTVAHSMLFGLNLRNATQLYYVSLAALIATQLLVVRMIQSPAGMVLRGTQQNPQRLQSIGYPTFRYRLMFFVISSALCGLAGVLFVNAEGYASPSMLHWTRSAEFIIIIIIGGMRTLLGPIIGTVVLLCLESFLGTITNYWQAVLGFILMAIVIFGKQTVLSARNA